MNLRETQILLCIAQRAKDGKACPHDVIHAIERMAEAHMSCYVDRRIDSLFQQILILSDMTPLSYRKQFMADLPARLQEMLEQRGSCSVVVVDVAAEESAINLLSP
jgi:hypothetical protein